MGHKNTNEPKTCDYANIELEKRVLLVCTCVWFSVLERDGNTDETSANPPQSYHRKTHSHKEINVEDQACGFMPPTTNTSTGKHRL